MPDSSMPTTEATEKAKSWHRRSMVTLGVAALVFILLSALGAPKVIVFLSAFVATAAALWMMWATMWVFASRAEADMDTMDEDEPPV